MTSVEESFTRSHVAEKLLWLDGKPFRLHDYPFFRGVYNIQVPEIVLKTGRQVAKTQVSTCNVITSTGRPRMIKNVSVGDSVLTLGNDSSHIHAGRVTWKSDKYFKPCLRIKTRLGHILEVATTHPVRTWDDWVVAERLKVGSRVASIRKGGFFTNTSRPPDWKIEYCAFMIGDGACGVSNNFAYTQVHTTQAAKRFRRICSKRKWKVRPQPKTKTSAVSYCLSAARSSEPRKLLEKWNLWHKYSAQKIVPNFVWELSRKKTSLFLNRLWSTDGHVSLEGACYHIEYSSISEKLVRGVQALLWKFGVPSKVWGYVPDAYRGTDKRAYKLRVETQDGVRIFLQEVGALGKSENMPLPSWNANNNRDTYPIEVTKLIQEINASARSKKRRGCRSNKNTLHAAGLRNKPKYALSRRKLQEYVDHFRGVPEYDQQLVDRLAVHLDTDLYWDEVISIEDIGKQECRDIEVRSTGNFVSAGVVTHNSTCCANLMLVDSIMIPHFRTLYISPSREQTSKFSNTRLSKIIHYSPLIRNTYVNPKLSNNVLLQILGNGSEMSLSYADDDPDRVRGITADRELIDEVQDILYDAVIPVVKECMANSDHGYVIYAGTPKSMENTIEYIWKNSTQSEWIMKCPGCGSWQYVDSSRSIGRNGVVCVKCDKPLNPREGMWYDFNPNARVKGFHISQPILPRNNEVPMRWQRILEKLENYTETKFKNEVLGVSDSIGSRYISQDELLELCDPDYFVRLPLPPSAMKDIRIVVGGVDWGGGTGEEKVTSRTVAWVYGLTHEFKLKTLYYEVFPEDNPAANVRRVAEIFGQCGCQMVVGDAGGGAIANAMLRDHLGEHRMAQCQYGGGAGFDKLIRWSSQASRYLVNRTAAIDSYMMALKNHEIIFPNVRQMATPIQDILNEYEEMTTGSSSGSGRRLWRHAPSAPDDCLHAQIYAWLAMKVVQGDVVFYENREDD